MKEEAKVKQEVSPAADMMNANPMNHMNYMGPMPQMPMMQMPQMQMPQMTMPQMAQMPQMGQMPMTCCPYLMNLQCPMLYNQYMPGMAPAMNQYMTSPYMYNPASMGMPQY